MKQPIALDLFLLEQLSNNWSDYKIQRSFHKMTEFLEKYHSIPIDNQGGFSDWLNGFRKILNSIQDQNIRKMFKDLLGPRNLKYDRILLFQVEDLLKTLADSTPDKIGLQSESLTKDKIRYYRIDELQQDEYDPRCRLLRYGKIINFKYDTEFYPSNIIAPYIREASKIEYFDPFLFKDQFRKDDAEFLYENLEFCKNPTEIRIYTVPNPLNVLQKEVEIKLTKKYSKSVFKGIFNYYKPIKDVNHDRFIILNHNWVSIFFSTSFNNLRKTGVGKFRNGDAFIMNFCEGRNYYE